MTIEHDIADRVRLFIEIPAESVSDAQEYVKQIERLGDVKQAVANVEFDLQKAKKEHRKVKESAAKERAEAAADRASAAEQMASARTFYNQMKEKAEADAKQIREEAVAEAMRIIAEAKGEVAEIEATLSGAQGALLRARRAGDVDRNQQA